mmetsp:Transcript_8044/g.21320  ORF Transcript_8044/g.21320 Transcript_8044/m.21320 type:complete len:283 (-) Transcript_8044:2-850(-)
MSWHLNVQQLLQPSPRRAPTIASTLDPLGPLGKMRYPRPSLLWYKRLREAVCVVKVRAARTRKEVLRVILVVRAGHPHPVRVPREAVLSDPGAATLGAATVEVSGDGVGVLLALALTGGLHPLDCVALGLDADGACILENHHRDDGPQRQEGRDHPHGELLEPSPIWGVVLREVAVVDGVEDTSRQQRPMLPIVAVIPDRLVQGVLLRGAVGLELRRRGGRHVEVGRGAAHVHRRGRDASAALGQGMLLRAEQQHGARQGGPRREGGPGAPKGRPRLRLRRP